jgi:hypothetical protein
MGDQLHAARPPTPGGYFGPIDAITREGKFSFAVFDN